VFDGIRWVFDGICRAGGGLVRASNVNFNSLWVSKSRTKLTRTFWSTPGTAQTSVDILGSSFPYRGPFE
jgi:hypothetical protein